MLHPSYSELIDIVNTTAEENGTQEIQSRYSIVIAAAKRARQIVDGDEPLTSNSINKALSIAVEEMNEAKVTIVSENDHADDTVSLEEAAPVEEILVTGEPEEAGEE